MRVGRHVSYEVVQLPYNDEDQVLGHWEEDDPVITDNRNHYEFKG